MVGLKNSLKNRFSKLKKSYVTRKISFVFLLCIFIFAQFVGYLTIAAFSGLSQMFDNIKVPDGAIDLNLDIYNPEDMEVNFPYYIRNQGIYDLNNLNIDVSVFVNYIDVGTREDITIRLFAKVSLIPDCKAFSYLIGNFTGTFLDFNITAVVQFVDNVDYFEPFSFFTDINFRADYFWGLIDFSIFLDDLSLLGI